jgi:hypothetical protein
MLKHGRGSVGGSSSSSSRGGGTRILEKGQSCKALGGGNHDLEHNWRKSHQVF